MPEDIIKERATLVLQHAHIIQSRISAIQNPNDFIDTDANLLPYDSLIIRFRDLISHHYELLDYEIIYQICVEEIPKIIEGFEKYLAKE